eukprot:1140233-Pelagomonas_calceolata.AAC.6
MQRQQRRSCVMQEPPLPTSRTAVRGVVGGTWAAAQAVDAAEGVAEAVCVLWAVAVAQKAVKAALGVAQGFVLTAAARISACEAAAAAVAAAVVVFFGRAAADDDDGDAAGPVPDTPPTVAVASANDKAKHVAAHI